MQNKKKLLALLEEVFGKSKFNSGDYYYFYSPFKKHRKQKLAINLNTDVNGFNLWTCFITPNNGKTIYGLFKKANVPKKYYYLLRKIDIVKRKPIEETKEIKVELPIEFKPLYIKQKMDLEYNKALNYLLKVRKISKLDIAKYKIGYCTEGRYKNMLIFPSYDEKNNLNFFTARTYIDNNICFLIPKNIKRNFIGYESYINWNLPVVITEGALDAIAIKRNAIPLFGKTINDKLKNKILEHKPDVYLCLDGEAIGSTLRYAEYFLNEGISVYIVYLEDEDPCDLGYVNIQRKIKQSKPISKTELLKLKLKYKL